MDRRVRQIVEGFERLLKLTEGSFLATVVSEPEQPLMVKDMNGTEYLDVRKTATEGKSGFILNPKKSSWVLVSRISNSNELYISMVSEVDSIEMMGGENGGLIKVEPLVEKLNKLEADMNAIKEAFKTWVPVYETALKTSLTDWSLNVIVETQIVDIENDKITH